ncbi:MAG TPA: hypothetical protein VHG93_10300 [Longimicrobium sp.]|nr:hypothetical protein [Longimicrobium sp.]
MTEQSTPTAVLDGAFEEAATPLTTVVPENYQQLRQLAESAVSVANQEVDFFFRGGATLERRVAGAPLADDDVLVPTLDDGKFPANQVTLAVSDQENASGTFTPSVGTADAVFWSDAAVQKFLFPYVASCGGDSASQVLTQVQRAWNWYHVDRVTVYALIHMTSYETGVTLGLERAIWVVFALAGSSDLQAEPLVQFMARGLVSATPPALTEAATVDYRRGVDGSSQHPDYVELRALADWAASIRGYRYFVFPAGQQGFVGPFESIPPLHAGDIVVPVHTASVPNDRPYLGGMWFAPAGDGVTRNVARLADAIFWSTAAVEQFLFPYYASKGGLQALPDLADIHRVWTEPQAEEVYGLVHLPTSEWAEITEQGVQETVRRVEPLRQLGFVSVDAQRRTHVTRADRFIAHRWGRGR